MVALPSDEPRERFKSRLDEQLELIKEHLASQQRQIDEFRKGLPDRIGDAVRARREKIQQHEDLQGFLGIPLKRREDAPALAPIPMKRQLVGRYLLHRRVATSRTRNPGAGVRPHSLSYSACGTDL